MKLYAVFRTGVYRHECGGIFDTLKAARDSARAQLAIEPDAYHAYEVVPFVLNERLPQGEFGNTLERDVIVTFDRKPMDSDECWTPEQMHNWVPIRERWHSKQEVVA